MIVVKIIGLWVLSGLIFNIIVEGFPKPNEEVTRAKRRTFMFDIVAGPIGYLIMLYLLIEKMRNK